MTPEFKGWPKIPRLHRDVIITEKIDGTNACVIVTEDGEVAAQSRTRIITPEQDNFGFAAWVQEHADELRALGAGYHFGEWYGKGIQRTYGLDERRFALFSPRKQQETLGWGWMPSTVPCCEVVPVLWQGTADRLNEYVERCVANLRWHGSYLVPGFTAPEGLVVYHTAARQTFKVLLEGDDIPKGVAA